MTHLRELMRGLLLAVLCFVVHPLHAQSVLDRLAIEVKGASREFAFTNKESAFYYGETNSVNSTSWQGFNVFGHEFLDDYTLTINGVPLNRSSALKTIVYPDYLKRIYSGGIIEQLRIADTAALFSVIVSAPRPVEVGIAPSFTDGRTLADYKLILSEETALIARQGHLARTNRDNYPVWLGIHGKGFEPQQSERRRGNNFSPLVLHSVKRARVHVIAFAVADTPEQTARLVHDYPGQADRYFRVRRTRMERLLEESKVQSQDSRFDEALAWAKISLDALIMNQRGKGIFAGLPWFNNYWGRDTFISLPGATLVTGRFEEAKKILQSFAAFQQTDSTSTDYGRIPNTVTTTDKAYNTADGTPRFVMMAREYVRRSGDSTFILGIYPTIFRSIEGTLKYHTDSLGFLTHMDAETWMDAVGPDGPWSPRGNRANDIQALWAQQLNAGVWFATEVGDFPSARRWDHVGQTLAMNFAPKFVSNRIVADHLNGDGSKDAQVRPNQIFACPLFDDTTRADVVMRVARELTYEYGIASLSQNDENFHPFHVYPPYYPKDAAYHNGIVWTWLQGALISELCRLGKQDLAGKLTKNAIYQILDRGAVGTQSELLDALPRPGEKEPRLSGTFSQAWNLAEFVRNFYDDYLGVQPNLLENRLILRPRLPSFLGKVASSIKYGSQELEIAVEQKGGNQTIVFQPAKFGFPPKIEIELPTEADSILRIEFTPPRRTVVRINIKGSQVSPLALSDKIDFRITKIRSPFAAKGLDSLSFANPSLRQGLIALKGPSYPIVLHARVKSSNPGATMLIDVSDPEGDDIGTGEFTYPVNPAFVPGCFDIVGFSASYDAFNAYFNLRFRALSNPGWHPEYGFQLTYTAIAIDEDGISGSGSRIVPHNADYRLEEQHSYEKLIVIGGGVQIEDARGRILAAYIPTEQDVTGPLGDAGTGTIAFALPLSYLGRPNAHWTFTVLSGGQDDHGGAGIGEFRTVYRETSEWNGGGKVNPDDPNVYDVLVARPR